MEAQARLLPESVRTLWRRIAIGRAVLVGLFAFAITALARGDMSPLVFAFPLGLTLVTFGIGWWWANARWRSWSFDLSARWISATWGVWTRRTVTIPRNRVQTVTTNDGPIDRLLNLQTITIHTAGGASPNLNIPHLEVTTVQWLREQLGQGVADR